MDDYIDLILEYNEKGHTLGKTLTSGDVHGAQVCNLFITFL